MLVAGCIVVGEASVMLHGWLRLTIYLPGMATRLSADLGLHLDITKHMHNGLLTSRDMEIRQTAFWGVFIHEQYDL